MLTVTRTLGELVTRTLAELVRPQERGVSVVLDEPVDGSSDLIQLTEDSRVSPTDLIEFGSELMLVTKDLPDQDSVRVTRGYAGSEPAPHAAGDVGYLNPQYARSQVVNGVLSALPRLEGLGLPLTTSLLVETNGSKLLPLPDDVRAVTRVRFRHGDGAVDELDRWTFETDLPDDVISSGRALRLPRYLDAGVDLYVTVRKPYRTNPVGSKDESATVELPEGAEDLPALYAAAWATSGREVSRTQLDRAEKWSQSEPARQGGSAAVIRQRWEQFYRQLDEARRLEPPTTVRQWRMQPKVRRFRRF